MILDILIIMGRFKMLYFVTFSLTKQDQKILIRKRVCSLHKYIESDKIVILFKNVVNWS